MAGDEKKFEEALRELEGVVTKLESGDLTLEESLTVFEEGIALVKFLHDQLNAAEKKIEILLRDQGGKIRLEKFEEEK